MCSGFRGVHENGPRTIEVGVPGLSESSLSGVQPELLETLHDFEDSARPPEGARSTRSSRCGRRRVSGD